MKFKNLPSLLFLTYLLSITFLYPVHSQTSTLPNSGLMESYISLGDVQIIQTFDSRYEGLKGTPFLYEDWTEGYVTFKGKKEADQKSFKMNINMYDHTLYVVLYDGTVGPLPAKHVEKVIFHPAEERTEQFIPMSRALVEDINDTTLGYYQVIYQGDVILLKNHKKFFQEADYKGAYSSDIRYDEYKDQTRYYISQDGKSFEKIKLKRKHLEKALPGYDVKKISKQKKLDLSKEEDVQQLLAHLESKN